MTGYQVLARRFRPQRFEDLVGQDVVVRTLRNALASKQIAHAYLFAGLRGVGKTTVARLLAKALNCEHGPTPEPCGNCVSCTDITAGASMDVLEMDAASNRGIDDVRELREVARVLPVRDRYRVFILDEAHQLSKDAFGALLKILEEPPAKVVFILASTEKQKFPATILSRCLQVDFRPIPTELIVARLVQVAATEAFTLTPGASQLVARAAEGSLRDALSLLDRVRAFGAGVVDENAVAEVLGLAPFETLLAIWEALQAGDVAKALTLVREDEQAGHDPAALYEQFVQFLHEFLLLTADAQAPTSFPETQREALVASGRMVGASLLLRLLSLALEGKALVDGAERPGTAVAAAVGRLALWPRLRRVEALLAGEVVGEAPIPVSDEESTGPAEIDAPRQAAVAAPAPPALERLLGALEATGAHLLAGRVRSAARATVEGDTLVLACTGAPGATLRSLRGAMEQLVTAARAAGVATEVRVEDGGPAGEPAGEGLRKRVESDEAVQRVLQVFGGRLENIKETT
jgi:DNA polymerase-3 subunit gamma/tau